MILLKCENADFSYDGKKVLENVNFEVDEGDYICIVGENGSGKSTLAKGILGLKTADCGKISFYGGDKGIGYLPQQMTVQNDFPASVVEVVISGRAGNLGFKPFYSKQDRAEAESKMELLGVTVFGKKRFSELSGGQKQRVLLARALCAGSRLLLLDEPVAGLDPIVTAELYELIEKLNRELGIAVIMVTHDIPAAVKNAEKILHLGQKTKFFGTTVDYIKTEYYRTLISGENFSIECGSRRYLCCRQYQKCFHIRL